MIITLVPTRGRPKNAARLIDALDACDTNLTDHRLLFCVDTDDPELMEYERIFRESTSNRFGYLVDVRRRLAGTLNQAAQNYIDANRLDIKAIGFMGDDHLPKTRHWSDMISEIMMREKAIVYGNDLMQGINLPTAAWMHFDIIQALGYMVPPGLTHLFIDNAWKDLGLATNTLRYLPNMIIEHLHPHGKKAEWDERYTEVNSGAQWTADEDAYRAWHAVGFSRDVDNIVQVLV